MKEWLLEDVLDTTCRVVALYEQVLKAQAEKMRFLERDNKMLQAKLFEVSKHLKDVWAVKKTGLVS